MHDHHRQSIPPSAGSTAPMQFWVFSYNRGEFLQNCVNSIAQCAPQCPVTIFDDDSTDPATLEVLAALATRHTVRRPTASAGAGKHGGLYANMQAAFAATPDADLFCFLQDDMQLVRPLLSAEIGTLGAMLEDATSPRFLQPAFMKGADRKRHAGLVRFDAATAAYLIDRHHHSAGAWYSDILVGHAGRLRQAGWHFLPGEAANEQQARQQLGQLLYLKNPFAAWLPNVPAWRGKTRTLGLRLAHRAGNCGFHPLCSLSQQQAAAFVARDPAQLPYAEDWLTLGEGKLPEPWRYHPLQGRRALKLLNSLELKLGRLLRRAGI
jgi:hypothetical protein